MSKLVISADAQAAKENELKGIKNLIALYHKRIGLIEGVIKEGGDGDESPVYAEMQLEDMKKRLADYEAKLAELQKA